MNKEEHIQDIKTTLQEMLNLINVKTHKNSNYLSLFFRLFIPSSIKASIKANQYSKAKKVNKNITNKLNLLKELLKPIERLNEKG